MKKIDKRSMITQLIVLVFSINILMLIILSIYFLGQIKAFNHSQMQQGLSKLALEKAQVVNLTMKQVENEIENIALWTESILKEKQNIDLPVNYRLNDRGILVRHVSAMSGNQSSLEISNIYLPSDVIVTADIAAEIVKTEQLDIVFSQVRRRNPTIEWAYITTASGLMRILPYSDDYSSNENLDSDQDQRKAPFYQAAVGTANPSRGIVWTKPYLDYMGTGWMVTCSSPIYREDESLFGVVSLDVKLETLNESLLEDFRLGSSGFAFLVTNEGEIIFYPDYFPTGGKLGDLFEFNLLRDNLSKPYRNVMNDMISGKSGVGRYYDSLNLKHRVLAYAPVENLGWALGIEIDEQDYLIRNGVYTYNFVYLVFLALILIYLSGFVFRQYTRPIMDLTAEAEKIAAGKFEAIKIQSQFTEIQILSEAFRTMSRKIELHTRSLERRNRQVETIFNSLGGLLMIVTPDYEVVTMNDKGWSKYGSEIESIAGHPCYQIIAGRDRPCINCGIRSAAMDHKNVQTQVVLENRIYQNGYYPIAASGDTVDEVIVYSKDITEQIALEKELNQSEKMAGIGQISSAIAHEIKNPLAIIKGAVYILKAGIPKHEETMGRNVRIIDDAVTGAEKVIYNLLNFSSTSGRAYEIVNLSQIIEQILLFHRKRIIHQTIEVDVDFRPDPLMIQSNPDALKHVFLNLIGNAIDAVETGGKLTISGRSRIKDEQSEVVVTVEDNGCGMSGDVQDEIFRPFFSTKGNTKGTGLGLWITKKTVERLHGRIAVQSSLGNGSVMTVVLPAELPEKGGAKDDSSCG